MVYQVENIIRDVRICMDENQTDTALITDGDEETLRLDELIRSKIVEGVDTVHKEAPYYMLEQGHNFGDSIFWKDMESGYVLLPDDFMRPVCFEMSDWETPVYDFLTVNDPRYKKCRSRIKAIRGTTQRPVCVLAVETFGKILEFYSCDSEEATIERAIYIPYAKIDGSDGVDISKPCYQAAVSHIAGLVQLTLGETERGTAMINNATKLLQ